MATKIHTYVESLVWSISLHRPEICDREMLRCSSSDRRKRVDRIIGSRWTGASLDPRTVGRSP